MGGRSVLYCNVWLINKDFLSKQEFLIWVCFSFVVFSVDVFVGFLPSDIYSVLFYSLPSSSFLSVSLFLSFLFFLSLDRFVLDSKKCCWNITFLLCSSSHYNFLPFLFWPFPFSVHISHFSVCFQFSHTVCCLVITAQSHFHSFQILSLFPFCSVFYFVCIFTVLFPLSLSFFWSLFLLFPLLHLVLCTVACKWYWGCQFALL